MTETILYKRKVGKTYRLAKEGKKFIDQNWEDLTISEMSNVIGLSTTSIKHYMRKQDYSKRVTGENYKVFREEVLSLLKPYSGYLIYEEMRKVLKDKHNIQLTRDQLYKLVKDSDIETSYSKKFIRVFIDGNKNNLEPDNIILLTREEHKYMSRILGEEKVTGDNLLAAIELARLNIAKNSIKEVYIARNLKTGQVKKARNKTEISLMITRRAAQYKDCKKIGEDGERYIRDWVVTREIKEHKNDRKYGK